MKKELKGFVCGAVSMMVIAGAVSAAGVWDTIDVLRNDITVVVNGENVTADNFLYNDTTYLPLRAVSEALNQTVTYDEATNTAYIGERNDTVDKSKYTPPAELKNYIKYEDGVYYIWPDYIYELAEEKGISTNFEDIMANGGNQITIAGNSWDMVYLSNGLRYIPYDTFVDEILPFVEAN